MRNRIFATFLWFSVLGAVMGALWGYTTAEIRALKAMPHYVTLEMGARAQRAREYYDGSNVEMMHTVQGWFEHLVFVEAHVWAAGRLDGKALVHRDFDNPGWFFLRLEEEWVFVPEGRFPELLALGVWLFCLPH